MPAYLSSLASSDSFSDEPTRKSTVKIKGKPPIVTVRDSESSSDVFDSDQSDDEMADWTLENA